nr:MAG TPA: hypothetical protein [Caudoviricetes sp.]
MLVYKTCYFSQLKCPPSYEIFLHFLCNMQKHRQQQCLPVFQRFFMFNFAQTFIYIIYKPLSKPFIRVQPCVKL